jgi:transposase
VGLSWNAVDGIMQRAGERGLSGRRVSAVTHLGVDETAFKKRHDYVTIVLDQDSACVLHVGQDRKKATLTAWYDSLNEEQLASISSVSMDMWLAYINATLEHVPEAAYKIAFDKFHVA